jgi:predicted nucleic acid-binding protein
VILFDVNVLLNAHRPAQEDHRVARELLETVVNAPAPFAVSELVLTAFLRIATNPPAFTVPTPLDQAFRRSTEQRGSRPPGRSGRPELPALTPVPARRSGTDREPRRSTAGLARLD